MRHLRHWLIVAALWPALYSNGTAAEEGHAIMAREVSETAEPFEQPHLPRQSGWDDLELAVPGTTRGTVDGGRPGLREAVLASHAVQPLKRLGFGFGLSHDALVNGFTGWYGVYLKDLDRVAERDTIYGLLRETSRFSREDGKTPSAQCCQGDDRVTSLDQHTNAMNARAVSPTFFVFGLLRKKEWKIDFDDGWKLQAGLRRVQYGSALKSKIASLSLEREWENVQTSYSYELERSSGVSMAGRHVLQFDYLYSPRDSIGVSVASGRRVAYFGALGNLNTETRSVAFSGQHWFKQDWALTFEAGYNDHGDMPAQAGIRAGLRHSF